MMTEEAARRVFQNPQKIESYIFMRLGKLRESVWQRSVEKQLHKNLNRYKAASHSDALVLSDEAGRQGLVRAAIEPVQGWRLAAERVIARAVCTAAVSGMTMEEDPGTYPHLHVSVIMPENTEETSFKTLIRNLDRLAWEQKIFLFVDHAAVSPWVTTLLVHGSLLGTTGPECREKPGSETGDSTDKEICMIGDMAPEGTSLIAATKKRELCERYTADYLSAAESLLEEQPLKETRALLWKAGPGISRVLGEGGLFGGLWELASDAKAGLRVDLKKIPVRQHTIELCEYFRLNPYMLHAGGSILLLCRDGSALVNQAREAGVKAAVIGRTYAGRDRTISYDGEIRYLEPPHVDEIYKLFNEKDGGTNAQ